MTAAVTRALMSALQGDSVLAGLAPGGVQWGVAPEMIAPKRTVIVSMQTAPRVLEQGGVAHLTTRYQVKVVDPATSWASAATAYERIEALLENASLTIQGHACMAVHAVDEFSYIERTDAGGVWQHVGGDYEVWSDPSPS